MGSTYIWEIRSSEGGMLGLEVAKSVMAPADCVLAHSLPSEVEVVVRDDADHVVAQATSLAADGDTPMARLHIDQGSVRRSQVWPDATDTGRPVILPGGEVGILQSWWNAEDGSEWRWQVEFSNHA